MGKLTKSMSFKSAVINVEDMTLTEELKDETNEFDIMDILKAWDGIPGVSITIKQDTDYVSAGGEE